MELLHSFWNFAAKKWGGICFPGRDWVELLDSDTAQLNSDSKDDDLLSYEHDPHIHT